MTGPLLTTDFPASLPNDILLILQLLTALYLYCACHTELLPVPLVILHTDHIYMELRGARRCCEGCRAVAEAASCNC